MSLKSSYRKGYRGETELASRLSAMFNIPVRRGASPYTFGFIARDIVGLPGIHCEVKRRERLSLPAALRQAAYDANEDVPVVAHRANHEDWLLTVRLCDLPALAERIYNLSAASAVPIRQSNEQQNQERSK